MEKAIKKLLATPRLQQGSLTLRQGAGLVMESLSFQVDAPFRCKCTCFLHASEDAKTGQVSTDITPAKSVNYDIGMDQQFPPEGTQNPNAFTFNTMQMRKYMKSHKGTFPVLIRVESLTAAYAAYDLDSLPAGSPLDDQPGVVCHSTFAKLTLTEGHWSMTILGQRLWANGKGYDIPLDLQIPTVAYQPPPQAPRTPTPIALQPATHFHYQGQQPLAIDTQLQAPFTNIPTTYPYTHQQSPSTFYNNTAAAPLVFNQAPQPQTPPAAARASQVCMNCRARRTAVAFAPCGHACMCTDCSVLQQQQRGICPLCSQHITQLVSLLRQ